MARYVNGANHEFRSRKSISPTNKTKACYIGRSKKRFDQFGSSIAIGKPSKTNTLNSYGSNH